MKKIFILAAAAMMFASCACSQAQVEAEPACQCDSCQCDTCMCVLEEVDSVAVVDTVVAE